MTMAHLEEAFETAIADALVHSGGYTHGDKHHFNLDLVLDPVELLAFVQDSQPKQWSALQQRHGAAAVEKKFLDRVKHELDNWGMLHILRKGVTDLGVHVKLAYFKPAHGLAPKEVELYGKNRLTVTRQVRYSKSSADELDLVLALNGLPVATAELKMQTAGQGVAEAVKQYREDRDPKELLFQFKKRALVHFAVDADQVQMTTELKGRDTRFLPFNKGRGDGKKKGAGNPDNPNGHKTAYLWDEVWARDSWMDILGRFIHVEREDPRDPKSAETVIFPRYHQLDAVRLVEADARSLGIGQKYLIQHSAGSGKSNTIAWLAHGLFRLHDRADKLIFDSVVIITDRKVLDRQLQSTVSQFEQTQGVVVGISKGSKQLAAALAEGRHIIVTTLQTFPFVLDKVSELGSRTFAVLIDEAHSSQTGESARKMREVLTTEALHAESLEAEDEGSDFEDELAEAALASRKNVSFTALTATPKLKTIEIFGRPGIDGKAEAFHVYSMRQAIEEKFILDVLLNYTTYKTLWSVEKTKIQDPEVEARKAKMAIARFVSLHPHNISQKVEIIVEHFRKHSRYKISGRAKAMVVTRSRLHAVRYKLAIDVYLKKQGYTDIKALVAFSGEVFDKENAETYTEPGMNRFPEKQTPTKFATEEYQVLLVAEKYQTGYDQPLLHSMYVDKRLDGVKAVQTLSRLNRTYPGKDDTFILDFVNKAEDIQGAFEPYFDETRIEQPTDPNRLYDFKTLLDGCGVYQPSEVEAAQAAIQAAGKKTAAASNAALNAALDPGVGRFLALNVEGRDSFRSALISYVRLYSFLLHVITFADADLGNLYDYCRFLQRKLPRAGDITDFQVDDYVLLRRHRLAKVGDFNVSLGTEDELDNELPPMAPVDVHEEQADKKALSSLIDQLNKRFGSDLTDADQLSFEQVQMDLQADEELAQQALANDEDNYAFAFGDKFGDVIFERFIRNGKIFKRMQDDPAFRDAVMEWMRTKVYRAQRNQAS